MNELKRRRQALTAAVYGEARVEGFDGHLLRLVYPEEQGFHVGIARERAHTEKLCSVLEERLGSRPRLEIRAAGGESAAPVTEEPRPTPMEPPAPDPRPDLQEPPPERSNPNGKSGSEAQNSGPAPQATAGDGVIQNEREVFDLAREYDEKS